MFVHPKQQDASDGISTLDQCCLLDIDSAPSQARLTGIICTIEEQTRDVPTLLRLMEAGMNIVRVNLHFSNLEAHAMTIENVREAASLLEPQRPIAIAVDTVGPEILTGSISGNPSGTVDIFTDSVVRVSTRDEDEMNCTSEIIYVNYYNIVEVVKPEGIIRIDDGKIWLVVKEIDVDVINCVVERGGVLGSKKTVNLPGAVLDLPAVSERDRTDYDFAITHKVDMVFASCVRTAENVEEIRDFLGEAGEDIKIIAAIENQEGIRRFDEILEEADGILVSRRILGIEIPPEKVYIAQRMIIGRCNRAGKPVICANHMMESMVKNREPTRAEISAIAGAVDDGSDCLMLSAETTIGQYPVESVLAMSNACREAEAAVFSRRLLEDLLLETATPTDATMTCAIAAVSSSFKCHASAIVVMTTTGRSAIVLALFRPRCPIIAVTRCERVSRQMHLHRGIYPVYYPFPRDECWEKDLDLRIQYAIRVGKGANFVLAGESVIVIHGWKKGPGFTNTFRLIYA